MNNRSSYELLESVIALVEMIPADLRDDQFIKELNDAQESIFHAVFNLLKRKRMLMKSMPKR